MHTIYIYTFRSTSYWLYLELNEMVSGLKKPWCAARQAQHRCEENGAMLLLLFEAWNALPQPIASLEKSGACLEIIDYQIAESFIHRSQCQQHWKKQWKPKTVEAAKTAARCRAKGAWGQVRRCKNFHWSDIYIFMCMRDMKWLSDVDLIVESFVWELLYGCSPGSISLGTRGRDKWHEWKERNQWRCCANVVQMFGSLRLCSSSLCLLGVVCTTSLVVSWPSIETCQLEPILVFVTGRILYLILRPNDHTIVGQWSANMGLV